MLPTVAALHSSVRLPHCIIHALATIPRQPVSPGPIPTLQAETAMPLLSQGHVCEAIRQYQQAVLVRGSVYAGQQYSLATCPTPPLVPLIVYYPSAAAISCAHSHIQKGARLQQCTPTHIRVEFKTAGYACRLDSAASQGSSPPHVAAK